MIVHFIAHYQAMGIDFVTRSNLSLHVLGGAAANRARERRSIHHLISKSIPFDMAEKWSSGIKTSMVNAYLRSLPRDAFLMYPDLDEFFSLPCHLNRLTSAATILVSSWSDRLALRWACSPQPRL